MKRTISVFLATVALHGAHAQLHITTIGADPLFSTVELDVMRPLPRRISIGLPWVYVRASSNMPDIDTFARYSSPSELQNLYLESYYTHMEGRIGYPTIGFRVGDYHNFRLTAETINEMRWTFRTDLAALVLNGNAPYIGDTLNLLDQFAFQSYQRYTAGYMWAGPTFGVGVNLHYYRGNGALQLDPAILRLYTHDTTLHLDIESDMVLHSTIDTGRVRRLLQTMNTSGPLAAMRALQGAGSGFGVSVGGRVRLLDFLNLSGAWTNIGGIKWKNALRYSLKGSTTYRGLDLRRMITQNSVNADAVRDSLLAAFQFDSGRADFSTPTTQRFFVRADLAFSQVSFLPIGFVVGGEKAGRWRMAYGAYLNMTFFPPVGLTFSASYRDLGVDEANGYKVRRRKTNWGVAVHGDIAEIVGYYVAVDNIPFKGFADVRHVDAIVGISLHLGKRNPYRTMSKYVIAHRDDVSRSLDK